MCLISLPGVKISATSIFSKKESFLWEIILSKVKQSFPCYCLGGKMLQKEKKTLKDSERLKHFAPMD